MNEWMFNNNLVQRGPKTSKTKLSKLDQNKQG